MSVVALGEAVVGGLLLFFVPGFAVARALFPEWRFRGPDGPRRALETVTLSFVLSVVLTIVVGFGLLSVAPNGFSAAWTDPVLEGALAGIAAVALVASWLRGAWSHEPPRERTTEGSGEEGAWELSRELERLARDERHLEHALRTAPSSSTDAARISAELESVRAEREALRKRREEEYAS